jgi:hypothetical protein
MFENPMKIPAVVRAGLLVGICVGQILFVSCADDRATGNLAGNARMPAFNTIREGTDEVEVRRLLGSPDEIRVLEEGQPLDGIVILDARPGNNANRETRRWAYGPKQHGTFARGGVVSFDPSNKVLWAESPVWRAGGVFNEVPEARRREWPASSKSLSCRIDKVRLTESPDRKIRSWFATVTVTNSGGKSFATDCYLDSIGRLVVIEVCDDLKTPIFRVDRNHLNDGFAGRASVFTLAPHTSRTEEVHFDPQDYFGPLVPGQYYVRAFFRWRSERFVASELAAFEVPPFPEGAYWDRFRTNAFSGRGEPRR